MKLKKNEYVSKDVLLPLIKLKLSIPQIAKQLNVSVFKTKMSLIQADLFVGKKYAFICEACNKTFYHFIKGYKFCSNSCKHKTKFDDPRILELSNNKLGNDAGLNSEKLESMHFEKLGINVFYNPNSYEKSFLLTLENKPGLTHVEKFTEYIAYKDDSGKVRKYKPDFLVCWEGDIIWLVEVKGMLQISDIIKCDAARKFADEHGFQYRIYTKGFIKYDIWNRFYTYLSYFNVPSKEFIMMNNAVCWSLASCSHSRRVGCVVGNDLCNEILSIGYNGDEMGGSNVAECLLPGESGWIHAEENALLKLGTSKNCIMFLTDSPCEVCAKKIINSRKIKEVYYLREYRDLSGVGKLIANGIMTYKFVFLNSRGEQISDNMAFDLLKPGGFDKFES